MVHTYLYTILLASSFAGTSFASHKIVFLISTPRSVSTAFVRAMQARGEVDKQYHMSIFNEPFMPAWWKNNGIDAKLHSGVLDTYQLIIDQLLQEAERGSIFIKEQSFIVQDLLKHDDRLFNNPDVRFALLLRNPHPAIISFYKKLSKFGNSHYNFADVVGQKCCYELFQEIKKSTGKAPVVIITEELYERPYEAMQHFCEGVDIPFIPEALQWESLGSQFDGTQAWHEAKREESTHHWHGDAIMSTGFTKPREYDVDAQGNPTFIEIENHQDREVCKKAYEENMHYYNLILQSIGK